VIYERRKCKRIKNERTKYESEKKEEKCQQGNGGTLECRVNGETNKHRRYIYIWGERMVINKYTNK